MNQGLGIKHVISTERLIQVQSCQSRLELIHNWDYEPPFISGTVDTLRTVHIPYESEWALSAPYVNRILSVTIRARAQAESCPWKDMSAFSQALGARV
jgi:hypothetical protein